MNPFDLREPVSALTHGLGLILALPGTILLWRRAGCRARRVSLLLYGLSLAFCYGASALYHGVRGDGHGEVHRPEAGERARLEEGERVRPELRLEGADDRDELRRLDGRGHRLGFGLCKNLFERAFNNSKII